MRRPKLVITIYSHDRTTTYIVKTEYVEHPGAEPLTRYDSCTSAGDLYRKVAKHVRHAKEMTYDYKVEHKEFSV